MSEFHFFINFCHKLKRFRPIFQDSDEDIILVETEEGFQVQNIHVEDDQDDRATVTKTESTQE